MLNYAGGDFSYGIGSSVDIAEANYGNADGVYTGVWIVSMDRRWSALNENESAKKAGVCLWGEHGQSRFMSYNVGATSMEFQSNYQKLLEIRPIYCQFPIQEIIGNRMETKSP